MSNSNDTNIIDTNTNSSTETYNTMLFNECIKNIHFNSGGFYNQKILDTLSKIEPSFLKSTNPNIEDWGKNHPRYLRLYCETFTEGHPCFDIITNYLSSIDIELTSYDFTYMIIIGVFWRYYNNTSIINHALSQLKASSYFKQIQEIPFTSELEFLLTNIGIENKYSYFKRYAKGLGYLNCNWFIDPSSYVNNIQLQKINEEYYKNLGKIVYL